MAALVQGVLKPNKLLFATNGSAIATGSLATAVRSLIYTGVGLTVLPYGKLILENTVVSVLTFSAVAMTCALPLRRLWLLDYLHRCDRTDGLWTSTRCTVQVEGSDNFISFG